MVKHRQSILVAALLAVVVSISTSQPTHALKLVKKPEQVSGCGALNEKPCPVWKAFPSCEKGLAEIPFQRCVKEENAPPLPIGGGFPKTCGGENQRPCAIVEHIPSCKSGLVENFLAHRCLKRGEGPQLSDVVAGFEPPNCDEILGTGIEPSSNGLFAFKLAKEVTTEFGWDLTPKDSASTPIRALAAATRAALKYCLLTLERDVAAAGATARAAVLDGLSEDIGAVSDQVDGQGARLEAVAAAVGGNAESIDSLQAQLGGMSEQLDTLRTQNMLVVAGIVLLVALIVLVWSRQQKPAA